MATYSPAAVTARNAQGIADYTATGANVHLSLIGWIVFLMALYFLNKTAAGHTIIFWALAAIAVYLLVANYSRIVPVLEG